VVWYVVKVCCERAGLERIAPHDLRRTCAKLCHTSGGELEQIQFQLGHASVQTTERYLGCKQNLGQPVNDRFVLTTSGCVILLECSDSISQLNRPLINHSHDNKQQVSGVQHCAGNEFSISQVTGRSPHQWDAFGFLSKTMSRT